MQNKIAVVLPVRDAGTGRSERLRRCLDSWKQHTEGLSDVFIILDDDDLHNYEYLQKNYSVYTHIQSAQNTLMQKINTIAPRLAEEYMYVSFIGDDITFETEWESIFIRHLESVPAGVVYGNDKIHGKKLATHPCVSSNLIRAVGFFGCPVVYHNYFDNYWMAVAGALDALIYVPEVVMRHNHPLKNPELLDELNIKIKSLQDSDEKLYNEYMRTEFSKDLRKIEEYLSTSPATKSQGTKSLDLGCGTAIRNPFNADEVFGIDIVDVGDSRVRVADLVIDSIPFEDNTFDYITGYDFVEHIPRLLYVDGKRRQPFIDFMSEVWRVLKPNGVALFATPAYPHSQAFQDPQHVNFISEETVLYFCVPDLSKGIEGYELDICRQYGFIGQFELLEQYWNPEVKYHLMWKLKAVK